MALAITSRGTGVNNGALKTSCSLTSSGATTAGSTLVIVVAKRNLTTSPALTLSDGTANSYSAVQSDGHTSGNNLNLSVYECVNAVAVANSSTVSASWTGSATDPVMWFIEVSGDKTASPLDGTAAAVSLSATNPSPGGITTTNAADIVIGIVYSLLSGLTPAASYTQLGSQLAGGSAGFLSVESQIVAATGTYTASWGSGGSNTEYAAQAFALQQAQAFTASGAFAPAAFTMSGVARETFTANAPLAPAAFAFASTAQSFTATSALAPAAFVMAAVANIPAVASAGFAPAAFVMAAVENSPYTAAAAFAPAVFVLAATSTSYAATAPLQPAVFVLSGQASYLIASMTLAPAAFSLMSSAGMPLSAPFNGTWTLITSGGAVSVGAGYGGAVSTVSAGGGVTVAAAQYGGTTTSTPAPGGVVTVTG